ITRALSTAGKAPRRFGDALEVDVRLARLKAAIGQHDTEPAASASRAAAVGPQTMFFDHESILDLLQLDRGVANIALADRDACGFAVFSGPSTPAAAEDVEQQESAAIAFTEPEERTAAHIALVRGRHG